MKKRPEKTVSSMRNVLSSAMKQARRKRRQMEKSHIAWLRAQWQRRKRREANQKLVETEQSL
jgi:hypothetical protein